MTYPNNVCVCMYVCVYVCMYARTQTNKDSFQRTHKYVSKHASTNINQ